MNVKPGARYKVTRKLIFHNFKVPMGTVLRAPSNIPAWVQYFLSQVVPVVYKGKVRLVSSSQVKLLP